MNDRLKFRVWDRIHKTYEHDCAGAYFIDMLGDLICIKEEDDNEDRVQGENFVVERCTGLKDKNGKLIYEGDVLGDGLLKAIVTWDDDRYVLEYDDGGVGEFALWVKTFEIIGNIHEMEVGR